MTLLPVGAGGAGEVSAVLAKDKLWVGRLVLTDYNLQRAGEVRAQVGSPSHMPVEFLDAGDKEQVKSHTYKYEVSGDPWLRIRSRLLRPDDHCEECPKPALIEPWYDGRR